MKKLSVLFLSVLALGLSTTSCNSDDDNLSIEGKWELSQIGGGTVGGEEQVIDYPTENSCAKPIIEFLKDGALITTYSQPNEGKCESFSQNGAWSQDGNNLMIKESIEEDDSDYEQKYEIRDQTKDKFKLYLSVTSEGVTNYQFIIFVRK